MPYTIEDEFDDEDLSNLLEELADKAARRSNEENDQ
jgi:hypothetical protein